MLGQLVDVWYPGPTEVRFKIDGTSNLGIAFEDRIIDLENGEVFHIQDILYNALEAGEDPDDVIIEWCEWIPIKEIKK